MPRQRARPPRASWSPERVAAQNAASRRLRAWCATFLRRYKSRCGCVDCGEHDWRCLTIDHTDGKTHDIPTLRSISAIKREIRQHKCVVRCANCHMIRTYEEQLGAPARRATMEATA